MKTLLPLIKLLFHSSETRIRLRFPKRRLRWIGLPIAMLIAMIACRSKALAPPTPSPQPLSDVQATPPEPSPIQLIPTPFPAQDWSSIPTEIDERLWLSPGPAQSEPGAPRLMILYPEPNTKLGSSEDATRYAGRVEPVEATVKLDGAPVQVYPGGVFTGLLSVAVGDRVVHFSAEKGGKTTTVDRSVHRNSPSKGLAHWPLAFHSSAPADAPGADKYLEFWLRQGSSLPIKLRASPGQHGFYRIAPGDWQPMQEVQSSSGGLYAATVVVDPTIPAAAAQRIEFRIAGSEKPGEPEQSKELTSDLTIRRLTPDVVMTGKVEKNLATFLKGTQGWERWGNWGRNTPFSVVERLGDRIRVDFGHEETGYVEMETVTLGSAPGSPAGVALPAPKVYYADQSNPDRLVFDWPLAHPIATVFRTEAMGTGIGAGQLTVDLVGADQVAPMRWTGQGKYFRQASVVAGQGRSPSKLVIDYVDRELWGYDLRSVNSQTLRLSVRLRPPLLLAAAEKPLKGVRIMLDAGHGGSDKGALGPSGLTEADTNLVLAGILGRKLFDLGADVRQIRLTDAFISLDDRVDQGLAFDPDLFISLHHNSVGMDMDPMKDHGPKVYYHYPFARPLAEAIAHELTPLWDTSLEPRVLSENFRVNRNLSHCPSVLVEGAFVCNPTDEIRLRQTGVLRQMSDAIAAGVLKLLQK